MIDYTQHEIRPLPTPILHRWEAVHSMHKSIPLVPFNRKITGEVLYVLVVCSLCTMLIGCDNNDNRPEEDAPPLTWESTSINTTARGNIPAEAGLIIVPESRTSGSARTISLSFVRFKSTAPNPAPPIIYLVGGPGNAGVKDAEIRYGRLFEHLLDYADVIALDQRGTGQSAPNLDCNIDVDLPPATWVNEDQMIDTFREASRTCADRWSQEGVDLSAYNTQESADDIDALRRALGEEQVTLIGYSYGTHLALAFAKQHPRRLHRMLLLGAEGPDHTLKLPKAVQQHLEDMAQLVSVDPAYGSLLPDLMGSLGRVLQRLDANPARVSTTNPFTLDPIEVEVNGFVVRLLLADILADSGELAALPAIIYALEQEQYAALVQAILTTPAVALPSAMTFMMDCASGATPARLAQVRQEASTTLMGTVLDFPLPDICDAWPATTLDDDFRAPVQSEVPTLVVSGTLDGRTPVSNGFDILQGLPNGVHVILENGGHNDLNDFNDIPGYVDIIRAFLQGDVLPANRLTLPFSFQ